MGKRSCRPHVPPVGRGTTLPCLANMQWGPLWHMLPPEGVKHANTRKGGILEDTKQYPRHTARLCGLMSDAHMPSLWRGGFADSPHGPTYRPSWAMAKPGKSATESSLLYNKWRVCRTTRHRPSWPAWRWQSGAPQSRTCNTPYGRKQRKADLLREVRRCNPVHQQGGHKGEAKLRATSPPLRKASNTPLPIRSWLDPQWPDGCCARNRLMVDMPVELLLGKHHARLKMRVAGESEASKHATTRDEELRASISPSPSEPGS